MDMVYVFLHQFPEFLNQTYVQFSCLIRKYIAGV